MRKKYHGFTRGNLLNKHYLKAKYGWYGLKNVTDDRIDSPRYGYKYFMYEDDFETYSNSNSDLDNGDILYARIDKNSVSDENITFYLNEGFTRYKLNTISEYPEIGRTKS